ADAERLWPDSFSRQIANVGLYRPPERKKRIATLEPASDVPVLSRSRCRPPGERPRSSRSTPVWTARRPARGAVDELVDCERGPRAAYGSRPGGPAGWRRAPRALGGASGTAGARPTAGPGPRSCARFLTAEDQPALRRARAARRKQGDEDANYFPVQKSWRGREHGRVPSGGRRGCRTGRVSRSRESNVGVIASPFGGPPSAQNSVYEPSTGHGAHSVVSVVSV